MTNRFPTCPCGHAIRVVRNIEGEITVELTADGPQADYRKLNGGLLFECTKPGCTEDLDEDLCDEVQDYVESYLKV